MKLYLIKQATNCGYDTYDSAVVIATSEEEARRIHPSTYFIFANGVWNEWEWKDGKKETCPYDPDLNGDRMANGRHLRM